MARTICDPITTATSNAAPRHLGCCSMETSFAFGARPTLQTAVRRVKPPCARELSEGRDDGLVDAVAVSPLGHGRIGASADCLSQARVALGAVRDDEEPAHRVGRVEVLE